MPLHRGLGLAPIGTCFGSIWSKAKDSQNKAVSPYPGSISHKQDLI